jgi:mRNA interferase RelE/StbE
MSFELRFRREALKEWRKLGHSIRMQLKKKLAARLESPRVRSAKLAGHADRYKIKLRNAGLRLVYQVYDDELVVLVVAVGNRDRNAVYRAADKR